MELKDLIGIFSRHKNLFFYVFLSFVLAGAVFYLLSAPKKNADINLNVTREGLQEASYYRYDEFYRLQADERFSDTIVRWLESERIYLDILNDSGVKRQEGFEALRLSSQFINIRHPIESEEEAKKLGASIEKVLNKQVVRLNEEQGSQSWFKVIVENPVVIVKEISFFKIISFSIMIGFFVAFWAVMIRHYLSEGNE